VILPAGRESFQLALGWHFVSLGGRTGFVSSASFCSAALTLAYYLNGRNQQNGWVASKQAKHRTPSQKLWMLRRQK
jgi:hypothetical protein